MSFLEGATSWLVECAEVGAVARTRIVGDRALDRINERIDVDTTDSEIAQTPAHRWCESSVPRYVRQGLWLRRHRGRRRPPGRPRARRGPDSAAPRCRGSGQPRGGQRGNADRMRGPGPRSDRVLEAMRQAGRRVGQVDPHQHRGVCRLGPRRAIVRVGDDRRHVTRAGAAGRRLPGRPRMGWRRATPAVSTACAMASNPDAADDARGRTCHQLRVDQGHARSDPAPADPPLSTGRAVEDDRSVTDLGTASGGRGQRDDRQSRRPRPARREEPSFETFR